VKNWREVFFNGGRCEQRAVFDASNKTIAPAGDGLDEGGFLGVVIQSYPQAFYRRVHAVLELHHSAVRPKVVLDFVPGNDLARPLQQEFEKLQRLALESVLRPVPAKESAGEL
jgi:hypothetical protein